MKHCFIAFAFIFLMFPPAFAQDFVSPQVNRLYHAIREEGGLSRKINLGKTLGAMKTPEACRALRSLMETPSSYWNQTAGVAGLFYFSDEAVHKALVNAFLDNHMIADTIEDGVLKNWEAFLPSVKDAFGAQSDDKKREKLLSLALSSNTTSGYDFVKSVIQDTNAPGRGAAMKLLSASVRPEDDAFIRSFFSEVVFTPCVMDYLLVHGARADLKLFEPYLDVWQDNLTPKAYTAVNLWEDTGRKEALFYSTLTSSDTTQISVGLLSFEGVTSERILARLCDIATTAQSQGIRRLACLNLLNFNDQRIVPVLERFLREPYIPRPQTGGDAVMNVASAGLIGMFDFFNRQSEQKQFNHSRQKIAKKLEQLTVNGGKDEK